MPPSDPNHARILLAVSERAGDDARRLWDVARENPTEDNVRSAFRACVLAARTLRRASEVWPDLELDMIEESFLIDESAEELKSILVLLVEARENAATAAAPNPVPA